MIGPGPDPGGGGGGLRPRAVSSWFPSVFALEELYPFLAMQADQAFIAALMFGSWTSSLLMASFTVMMPAIDLASWALLKSPTMFAHLFAAACAPTGKTADGLERLGAWSSGTWLGGAVKPYCAASAVPR